MFHSFLRLLLLHPYSQIFSHLFLLSHLLLLRSLPFSQVFHICLSSFLRRLLVFLPLHCPRPVSFSYHQHIFCHHGLLLLHSLGPSFLSAFVCHSLLYLHLRRQFPVRRRRHWRRALRQ
uniref:Uncharacterized protein n=1 Tax=Cacopsylla melanoneura TaxID=428564 RepID=A0A8D8RDZ7_9HEMI